MALKLVRRKPSSNRSNADVTDHDTTDLGPQSEPPPHDSVAFCREMLPLTSRTFALNVPMLPAPLGDIVAMAYLLCRVADTVEDEAAIPAAVRVDLLTELSSLVALPEDWQGGSATWAERACRLLDDGTATDQVRLVAGLPVLLDDLAGRPRAVRKLVQACVRDMTSGMAETVLRRPDRSCGLEDLDEVLGYCDIVAGTVGTMLTGLFAWHSGAVAAVLPELEPRAAAFGRVLQLTNIVKDVRVDLDSGLCWLPRSVLADCGIDSPDQLRDPALATQARGVLRRMIAATHRELLEALAYLESLPTSEVGIRRFCVAPLLMAVLTLRKLWADKDGFGASSVKISRRAVHAALVTTSVCAARPVVLGTLVNVLRRPLPRPLPPHSAFESSAVTEGRSIDEAIAATVTLLAKTQAPSGSWPADYGSMPVSLALHVITCYAVGAMPDDTACAHLEQQLRACQNPDGGWGHGVGSSSVVPVSVLCYAALRLLGVAANEPRLRRGRAWFLRHGGALVMPPWGNIFLAVLGACDWKRLSCSFIPEMWLLPRWLPMHPDRMWRCPRPVLASMSWLCARRAVIEDNAVLRELREELYTTPYQDVDWGSTGRSRSWVLKAVCATYEAHPSRTLRERAMATALDLIEHENRSSNHVGHDLIPTALDTLVWHFARPGGEEITAHIKRLGWDEPNGIKPFESRDTSFTVQALVESRHPGARQTLLDTSGFLVCDQHRPEHRSRGNTDETAEALKAILVLDVQGIAAENTFQHSPGIIDLLLSTQNPDGGWPRCVSAEGPAWLEKLDSSNVLDNFVLDSSTVEATSSCTTALRSYRARHPECRYLGALGRAIAQGEEYLLRTQRADGSWAGLWSAYFTYGTWLGVRGLFESRDPRATTAADRACEFLLAHQRADGGWGETIDDSGHHHYIHAATSQAAVTSWALLALVNAGRATSPAVRNATAFLLRTQQPDGDWPDQRIPGAMPRYAAPHNSVFPLWALSAVVNARESS
ncbi:squalene/phytoene synthase family protein [Amycolatopsis sp. NPDC049868]|uniref:squalene/phytoene synthase family protein n=1 Tax=Amycolatopsis sp. NPDC049868 TaxID=3363934 RepID=UPI0037A1DE06